MTFRLLHPGLLTLATGVAIACACVAPAHALPDGMTPGDPRAVRAAAVTVDAGALRLGRAVAERRAGNLPGVIENLEAVAFSTPSFAAADRAAFLLGQAYLELGAIDRFIGLARQVSAWPKRTAYTEWLSFQWRQIEAEGAGGRRDSASATAESRPCAADSASALQAEREGESILKRATAALARGEDPTALLERVPPGSRYASRARHMIGLAALERGDLARGVQVLESLAADDHGYDARREVLLGLAGTALYRGDWQAAQDRYRDIELDWSRQRESLQGMLTGALVDSMWRSWSTRSTTSDVMLLDGRPAWSAAERLASAALDLDAEPAAPLPCAVPLARDGESRGAVPPPSAEDRAAEAASARRLGEALHAIDRSRWATARESERLAERRRYLGTGRAAVDREAALLEARVALLDSLQRSLQALDRRLRAARDSASARIVARAAGLAGGCAKNLRWMRAMRHLHLDGPERERAGTPRRALADTLLRAEASATEDIAAVVRALSTELPELIERSYRLAWRRRLIDRAALLATDARRALAWARALGGSIDSSLLASSSSAALRRLAAAQAILERRADSLDVAHLALRRRIAQGAVQRALAGLDQEREAIDYGLATTAYAMSVGLPPPGDSTTTGRSAYAVRGGEPSAAAEERDDAGEVDRRARVIERMRSFIAGYPGSFARGEMRFRLADLLLVDARQTFHAHMARYLADQSAGLAGGREVPVLSHAPALALYRAILDEDRGFAHRDAVLFNAGMILADGGDPEAERFFAELVAEHPESAYAQEAQLQMGDMRFVERRYRESVAFYRKAAGGPDPSVQAIALYKMGWAHYNEDRFPEAADAFRGVLDLYASGRRLEVQADIEREAESYLVHSLAGAGGAPAFAAFFSGDRSRPYERRILLALGQQLRRATRYADAAAADELYLERYPLDADALLTARRLVETHQRAQRPAETRAAQRRVAERFVPGSAWHAAQASDSVRAEGARLARSSWMSLAHHHHLEARKHGSRDDWRLALGLYEQVLGTWPGDPERPTLALEAGEAATELGEYPKALTHYRAAESGPDSVARQASWQRVAVSDAWYQSTRGRTAAGAHALGRDSLAHAVHSAVDELLARYPGHPKEAELTWRSGQLSFAHGWHERAAADFGRLASRHPADPRAPLAAALRADALFRLSDFAGAGAAYEEAAVIARRAGIDSLARRTDAAVPVCAFRHAESLVAKDSTAHALHAAAFEKVAVRWPHYEHAHAALYRAGLAWLAAGAKRDGVRAMESLVRDFPRSEYVPDALLHVAKTWKALGERERAGEAFAWFAEHYPSDESARSAWLEAADLWEAAGMRERADRQRLAYIRRFPDDVEAAEEIMEGLARRDLLTLGPERPISALLTPAPPAHTSKKGPRPAAPPPSHLATYLALAAAHPALASRSLMAEVRFLQGEEALARYSGKRLVQPLKTSIAAKQKLLEGVIDRYRASVAVGDSAWGNASTFRIGEALEGFGRALESSERPPGLRGDDLRAYDEVLAMRSQSFYDRAEDVWSDLLRQRGRKAPNDPWILRAQGALWPRLGDRFVFRPEVDFPLVEGKPAPKTKRDPEAAALVPRDEPRPHGGRENDR